MKTTGSQPAVFEKIIQSDKHEADRLLDEALLYFSQLQRNGLAVNISEFNFRLALDEAVENAISHGNENDRGKKVFITIRAFQNKVDITIEDEGGGFKTAADTGAHLKDNPFSSHGRGLYLLKRIGTIRWNEKGNKINVVLAS